MISSIICCPPGAPICTYLLVLNHQWTPTRMLRLFWTALGILDSCRPKCIPIKARPEAEASKMWSSSMKKKQYFGAANDFSRVSRALPSAFHLYLRLLRISRPDLSTLRFQPSCSDKLHRLLLVHQFFAPRIGTVNQNDAYTQFKSLPDTRKDTRHRGWNTFYKRSCYAVTTKSSFGVWSWKTPGVDSSKTLGEGPRALKWGW